MHKAVKRRRTSTYEMNPELSGEGSNQGLLTGTSDEKLAKSDERQQNHLITGASKTDPIAPNRNYRNANLPPGKRNLSDSIETE